jgi:TldD protein
MEDLTSYALDKCREFGTSYADIRIVTILDEEISVKQGNISVMELRKEIGFGIRCIANGGWGFAGSFDLQKDEFHRVAELAARIAKASGSSRKKAVRLVDAKVESASYSTPTKKDPFKIPTEQKVDELVEVDKRLGEYNPDLIRLTRASFRGHKEDKTFASTDGAFITQTIVFCGGGFTCMAVAPGSPPQRRSYPASFGGDYSASGYEFFESRNLLENVERTANEAIALTKAKHCPKEKTTLILNGDQLALQIHESCGHPTELDRVLGTEAAYAGTSFMTVDRLNSLRYGSESVTLTADSTLPGGLGTFGYDDEGVRAKRIALVRDGLFVGYQSSRETAAIVGLDESSGGMRADSPQKIPLIRMVNINLEPSTWIRDDIIQDTKHGILMSTNKSWSIDDRRLNFQFGTEVAWEIVNGELGQMFKNPTYTGITPKFWGSMDASSKDDWRVWGTPNCGKGQPPQVMYVGHGCGTARFHNVRVGIMEGK